MKIQRIDSGNPLVAQDPEKAYRLADALFQAASQKWVAGRRVLLADISAMDKGQLNLCSNIRTNFETAEDPGYRLFYEFHSTSSQGWALLRFDHQENDVRWWTREGEVVYRVKVRDPHAETLETLGEDSLGEYVISYYKED